MTTGFVIIALLVAAAIRNDHCGERMNSCIAVLYVTAASYAVYYLGAYDGYVELIGYYQYQSIYPLISILILTLIRGKLATVLMVLYCIQITVNGVSFWIEGQGLYIDNPYQSTMWAVFAAQMALMFSRKLTDGIHRNLCRFNMAAVGATVRVHAFHWLGGLSDNKGEAKQ